MGDTQSFLAVQGLPAGLGSLYLMVTRTLGRPQAVWSAEEKRFLLHAQQAAVADRLTRETLAQLQSYTNPVVRLTASHAVLSLESECLALRRAAMWELREKGWSWRKIGSLMGMSKQRAHQIGNGI